MGDVFPHLSDACLYPGDPYLRIDPFFKNRLHLAPNVAPAGELPDDFMKPAGHWLCPSTVTFEDSTVSGPYGAIPIRVYRRKKITNASVKSWLLWMHGGGFTEGDLNLPEAHAFCAEMVDRCGIGCVSVDYRLVKGNTNRYPTAFEEILAVWQWLVNDFLDTDVSTIPQMFIGGASAGGNLASALCLKASDCPDIVRKPDGLLCAYGVFHALTCPSITGWEHNMSILPQPLRFDDKVFRDTQLTYVGNVDTKPRYSAAGESQPIGFPPTALICAEFDDLAQSTIQFSAQLQRAGVEVRTRMALGTLHGFLNWYPVKELPQTLETIDFFVRFVRELERRGTAHTRE
ncbi:alpha/beta hydrolase fold-3 domain protein [Bifidobacterium asteroides PRL2011]|nr:alpha/beta hydrolase fold-3 domain protein [Bifidobacterium asteroides PRL2011]